MDTFATWLAPYLANGSLLALPLVIVGGLITAFNPCCLPMLLLPNFGMRG